MIAVGEVEDGRRSRRSDPIAAGRRAAATDYRHPKGYARPPGSPLARLPQHRHQRLGIDASVPGYHEGTIFSRGNF